MKTTIEMAREAAGDDWGLFQEYMPEIHRLVELVRADERKQIIAINAPEIERVNAYIKALEVAVEAEREACAKEREACAYRAGIALLGADRGLTNRVDQAIRNRNNT